MFIFSSFLCVRVFVSVFCAMSCLCTLIPPSLPLSPSLPSLPLSLSLAPSSPHRTRCARYAHWRWVDCPLQAALWIGLQWTGAGVCQDGGLPPIHLIIPGETVLKETKVCCRMHMLTRSSNLRPNSTIYHFSYGNYSLKSYCTEAH